MGTITIEKYIQNRIGNPFFRFQFRFSVNYAHPEPPRPAGGGAVHSEASSAHCSRPEWRRSRPLLEGEGGSRIIRKKWKEKGENVVQRVTYNDVNKRLSQSISVFLESNRILGLLSQLISIFLESNRILGGVPPANQISNTNPA